MNDPLDRASDLAHESDSISNFYDGSEPVFGFFSQTKVALSGIRLTIGEKPYQNLGDLVTQLEIVRREFLHDGDCNRALQAVNRVWAQYGQRTQAWEAEAQRRERDKSLQSGEMLRKMRAEHSRVRNSIVLLERQFSKLSTDLNQICAEEALEREGRIPIDSHEGSSTKSDIEENLPSVDVETRNQLCEKTRRILDGIVGEGLELDYRSATRQVDDPKVAREEVWDIGKEILLVAGWYPTSSGNLNVNDFELRLWVIPKRPELKIGIAEFFKRFCFEIQTKHGNFDAAFRKIESSAKQNPRNSKIAEFVNQIKIKRFAEKSSLDSFCLYYSSSELVNEGQYFCELKLSVVN